ncbi:hypothetical protein BRADI_2g38445v3 [Brachypodium distachyon]|uniref:Uncharacterized protein n=1 Tax=Brachypodium distachyon TaxID=15368 RepID=A0A0Q3IPY0_BRADI|nr:hypothetical protein BRADI_2g38445v3 [Brachypodium distachyon]
MLCSFCGYTSPCWSLPHPMISVALVELVACTSEGKVCPTIHRCELSLQSVGHKHHLRQEPFVLGQIPCASLLDSSSSIPSCCCPAREWSWQHSAWTL